MNFVKRFFWKIHHFIFNSHWASDFHEGYIRVNCIQCEVLGK